MQYSSHALFNVSFGNGKCMMIPSNSDLLVSGRVLDKLIGG